MPERNWRNFSNILQFQVPLSEQTISNYQTLKRKLSKSQSTRPWWSHAGIGREWWTLWYSLAKEFAGNWHRVDVDAMIKSSHYQRRERERERRRREEGRKFPEYSRNFNRKLIRDRRESASRGGAHCERRDERPDWGREVVRRTNRLAGFAFAAATMRAALVHSLV